MAIGNVPIGERSKDLIYSIMVGDGYEKESASLAVNTGEIKTLESV